MTFSPTPAVLPDARALAIKYALPGHYDGISTFATQRGDADRKPYMLALVEALATPPASDAAVPAGEGVKCICTQDCPATEDGHYINCPAHTYYAKWLEMTAAAPKVASEDQAARDRRMYEQGRRDERAGEPEAFV
ncbi:MAG: hypothetical protein ABW128_17195 [Rhizorhabdus sp.]